MSPPLTLKIYRLAKVPAYVREPQRHQIELNLARQRALNDCRTMQRRLEILARSNHKNVRDRTMIRNEATLYGLVLGLRLLYIQLLRTIDDTDVTLLEETYDVRKTIHNLAGQIKAYQPLGTGYFFASLISAWAAADDQPDLDETEAIINDFILQSGDKSWKATALWLRRRYDNLHLAHRSGKSVENVQAEEDATYRGSSCFVQ